MTAALATISAVLSQDPNLDDPYTFFAVQVVCEILYFLLTTMFLTMVSRAKEGTSNPNPKNSDSFVEDGTKATRTKEFRSGNQLGPDHSCSIHRG